MSRLEAIRHDHPEGYRSVHETEQVAGSRGRIDRISSIIGPKRSLNESPRGVGVWRRNMKSRWWTLKFVDLIGTWQHFSIPVEELTEGLFKRMDPGWTVRRSGAEGDQ